MNLSRTGTKVNHLKLWVIKASLALSVFAFSGFNANGLNAKPVLSNIELVESNKKNHPITFELFETGKVVHPKIFPFKSDLITLNAVNFYTAVKFKSYSKVSHSITRLSSKIISVSYYLSFLRSILL